MASALTGSIAADGQTTPTANLPMGGFAHTNIGNATLRNMYPSAGQVQDGSLTYLTTVSGADTITAVGAVGMTAYAAGQQFTFVAAGANTGAATLNINSIGAKAITKNGATALSAGDIVSGAVAEVVYDGTQFQLTNVSTSSGNVNGPASSTDNAVARFDSTTGKIIQNSSVVIDDSGNATGFGTLAASGVATFSAGSVSAPAITTSGDTNTGIFFPAADTIAFTEGGVESMRIDSSGNVGIGITPLVKLQVKGGTSAGLNETIRISAGSSSANSGPSIGFHDYYNDNSYPTWKLGEIGAIYAGGAEFQGALVFYTNTGSTETSLSEKMRIAADGSLILAGSTAQKATGTTWSNPSDIRLKDNVTNYSKGLAELMQISVKEWTYNGKGGTTEGMKGLGVIADEIMAVLPNTVDTYQAKLNSDDQTETEIKKFDATEITWLMLNAIKELKAEIDLLKGNS
jgi:hypothetical protein